MFRTNRYVLFTGAVGVLAVVVLLLLYRHVTFGALTEHEARSNEALAQAFANVIWSDYAGFVSQASKIDPAQLSDRLEIAALQAAALATMRGTDVVKVKIYDLQGLTVFSTDPSQIGDDKSMNTGFLAARGGETVSNITYRDRFDAFDGVIVDRNVVSSYIPIHAVDTSIVVSVFEIYSDVTDLVAGLERTQWIIVFGVMGALSLLYTIVLVTAGWADRTIRQQESKRREDEEYIRYQAYHDALTGLPNRASFTERLAESTGRATGAGRAVALFFLDLDNFKLINDSLGHEAGDYVVRVAARRLQGVIRDGDSLFRMGGDEFMVIVEGFDSEDGPAPLAERIMATMREPMMVNGHALVVTTSLGISVFPRDANGNEPLTKNADAAMYRAKKAGRNRYEFYSPEMNARALDQLGMETDLQQALASNEFRLVYQPRVAGVSGEIVAVEALLRWHHPRRGVVGPDVFIPMLERNGLIESVGDWVLRTACRQNRAWMEASLPPLRVSVNISSRQFRGGDFVARVSDALAAAGLPPDRLELELTESLLIDSTEDAVDILESLKATGVALAIDDFGTGYSSLSYLKHLPIDYLKIDRSFIVDLAESREDAAIVNTVAALAKSLGIGLVAEGVETEAQRAILVGHDCDELQGYYFSRPVEPEAIEAMLAVVACEGHAASG